jgi:hypothetical protein
VGRFFSKARRSLPILERLGIAPFLHLGEIAIASALAGVAEAAPWATSEFISLLEKRKQAKRHGLYYLMNFK